jgi:hypothetical protein
VEADFWTPNRPQECNKKNADQFSYAFLKKNQRDAKTHLFYSGAIFFMHLGRKALPKAWHGLLMTKVSIIYYTEIIKIEDRYPISHMDDQPPLQWYIICDTSKSY